VVRSRLEGGYMSMETEINLYCPKCKRHTTEVLDTERILTCIRCGGPLKCTGFQVVDM
jgi:ribosomal protein L37AE/L43A